MAGQAQPAAQPGLTELHRQHGATVQMSARVDAWVTKDRTGGDDGGPCAVFFVDGKEVDRDDIFRKRPHNHTLMATPADVETVEGESREQTLYRRLQPDAVLERFEKAGCADAWHEIPETSWTALNEQAATTLELPL